MQCSSVTGGGCWVVVGLGGAFPSRSPRPRPLHLAERDGWLNTGKVRAWTPELVEYARSWGSHSLINNSSRRCAIDSVFYASPPHLRISQGCCKLKLE